MGKLIAAYILGLLSFLFAIAGVFSFFFSIPGLILGILSLKSKAKNITIPIGYTGKLGKKKVTARPFVSTHYLSYIAIGLNIFSMAVSIFATLSVLALFTAGMR